MEEVNIGMPDAGGTEIRIIDESAGQVDIAHLSADERELVFDKIARENPEIHRETVEGMRNAYEDMLSMGNRLDKPDIRELLLRKIIQYAVYIQQL